MPAEHRVFFALWPDEERVRQLDEAGRLARQMYGGRCMHRKTLHLTLAFIGGIAPRRLAALQGIAGTIRLPPFDLVFDRLQCLPRKRIAWASVSVPPTGLLDLAVVLKQLLDAADFRTEERSFTAHVTLLRNAVCAEDVPEANLRIEWPVQDFVLVESELRPEGARYRIMQRWSLMN